MKNLVFNWEVLLSRMLSIVKMLRNCDCGKKFAEKFDDMIKDNEEGWVLVTRKSKKRHAGKKSNCNAQQRSNFKCMGDLYQAPSEYSNSQWTYEDENDTIPQV